MSAKRLNNAPAWTAVLYDPTWLAEVLPWAVRVAWRRLGDWGSAEDAVQDTYIRLLQKADRVPVCDNPRALYFGFLRLTCKRRPEWYQAPPAWSLDAEDMHGHTRHGLVADRRSPRPDDMAYRNEVWEALRTRLGHLSPEQIVVVRAFVRDIPGLDAAHLLRDTDGLDALVAMARRACRGNRGGGSTGISGLDVLAGAGLDVPPPDAPATELDPVGMDAEALQRDCAIQDAIDRLEYEAGRHSAASERRREKCGADVLDVLEAADTWLTEEEVRQALDARGCCWANESVRDTLDDLVRTIVLARAEAGYGFPQWRGEKHAISAQAALDRLRLGLPQQVD